MADAGTSIKADGGLRQALRQARLAEAAHYDAALSLHDSKSLRLQVLKDEIAPAVIGQPDAEALFDLALAPGDPPKLWIDLISFVVMEPDHRTYRLVEDRQPGREILFESDDRAQMAERLRQHMAHRIIARQRQAAVPRVTEAVMGHSTAAVILAWLAGFSFGALGLLAAAILLEKLKF